MTDTQHTPEHQPGRGRDAAGLETTRVRGAMPMAAEGHSGPAVASAPAHSAPRYDGAAGAPPRGASGSAAGAGRPAATGQRASAYPRVSAPEGAAPAKQTVGIRRIRMTIAKVEPMSAMKIGFLLSVAIGVMIVIAMMLIWFVLDGMHVFSQMSDLFETLGNEELLRVGEYMEFGRWMAFAVLVGIIHIVLLTALSAIAALIYNLFAALVGGLRLTVTDE
ncbi:DUF3566 domain-containing protein [Actinotignum schaalii]|uniref:DUF3566 domain-containing protein n=1 Tax=Actinomycetaceae TaxID=2049 RepID=UPI00237E6E45|nr:DUF3566 domain-containing protein [Actinotignum schaalii]MDE1654826.1 DUF3566 domain-containing protein [Actinotignum schaalii]